MTGIVSPRGVSVMATALLLGGFVAPLFAFLGSAFVAAAIRERFEGRRRTVTQTARHRAF